MEGLAYTIRLQVTDGLVTAFTEYSFQTNLPPYGGTCEVSPEKGKAYKTLHINKQN